MGQESVLIPGDVLKFLKYPSALEGRFPREWACVPASKAVTQLLNTPLLLGFKVLLLFWTALWSTLGPAFAVLDRHSAPAGYWCRAFSNLLKRFHSLLRLGKRAMDFMKNTGIEHFT